MRDRYRQARRLKNRMKAALDMRNDRARRHRAARMAARDAEQLGIIVRPDACERCGDPDAFLERHHADHAKPLCVAFLCAPCHRIADASTPEPERKPTRGHCA